MVTFRQFGPVPVGKVGRAGRRSPKLYSLCQTCAKDASYQIQKFGDLKELPTLAPPSCPSPYYWNHETYTFGKGRPAHFRYAFSFNLMIIALKRCFLNVLHINTIYTKYTKTTDGNEKNLRFQPAILQPVNVLIKLYSNETQEIYSNVIQNLHISFIKHVTIFPNENQERSRCTCALAP
jgi:hypothetical protein